MRAFVQSISPLRQYTRLALVLFALLAFGAQQWAARTHWHGLPDPSALQQGTASPAGTEVPADTPAAPHPDCLWCHLAAHAGAIAPPPSLPALLLAEAHDSGVVPVRHSADFIPPAAFAWHSRGPPVA